MREKKKNTPFLKKSPGEKSNTSLFLQFSGRTLSHEKYPFTGHFGNTHAVIPTSEWGGRVVCWYYSLVKRQMNNTYFNNSHHNKVLLSLLVIGPCPMTSHLMLMWLFQVTG